MSDRRPVALVVDDATLTTTTLAAVLGRAGYEVVAVASAGEAIDVLQDLRPAVAVLDRRLPDGDGITLARELRHHPACTGTRLVLLSGEAVRAEDAAGFDACLVKPASVAAVLEAVGAARR